MKENTNNIDNIFDEEFDLFLQENIDKEFEPTQDVRDRIKKRVLESVEKELSVEKNLVSIEFEEEENRRGITMKNRKNNKVIKILAASIALILIAGNIGTFSVYGKDLFTVIKEVSTGNITMIEERFDGDMDKVSEKIPDELKGQIFDKEGKEVTELTPEMEGKIYTKDGRLIQGFVNDDSGKMKIMAEGDYDNETVKYDSIESAAKDLKFKPMIIPGFEVKEVNLYKGEDGKPSPDCVDIVFVKGDNKLFVQQRLATKENGYVGGGSDIKEVNINGVKGIITSGDSVDWEYKDKLIGVHASKSNLRDDKLLDVCRTMIEIK